MSVWLHHALHGWKPNLPAAALFAVVAVLLVLAGRNQPDGDDAP